MEWWEETVGCREGHRSSLKLETWEGGGICLLCFCNLVSDPSSLSVHVSYAVSQLSHALSQPLFRDNLLRFHAHLLVDPLSQSLSSCTDEQLAQQIIDLIARLCAINDAISSDFLTQMARCFCSRRLAWNSRHIYTLHCFGILLNHQFNKSSANIKEKAVLISNLVTGLQLPSEEIRGEILFVLYKLSILQDTGDDDFVSFCPRMLHLALEALMKTQNDDVRINCLALLTILAQKGYFVKSFASDQSGSSGEADNFTQTPEYVADTSLIMLFAEAIKGPLLSSDTQIQISALDLIFHSLSSEVDFVKQIGVLVEESVADYVFEMLRLSKNKDPLLVSCFQVLSLLATAEHAFRQRLVIGFPTLVLVLRYVAEVPLHPVQSHTLRLIWSCISSFPGIVSKSQAEDLFQVLTNMFRRHSSGDIGMLSDTFIIACSTFVALLKTPSSRGVQDLAALVQNASTDAVLASICLPGGIGNQDFLYSLYLLKEAYAYCHEENCNLDSENKELAISLTEVCETHITPCIGRIFNDAEQEEIILGLLETFYSILIQGSNVQTRKFAESLASSSWFSLSFGCLSVFPSAQMKGRVYLVLSFIVDRILGSDLGKPIRDAYSDLPSDPLDLLFLLGQKSSHDSNLVSCQSAVLMILYITSLFNKRLADEKQILASIEQYILVNGSNFTDRLADPATLTQLVHLYGLFRGAKRNNPAPYSLEAEKHLFKLIAQKEPDLISPRIHKTALKWVFEQDEITGTLSKQILNLCRFISSKETLIDSLENYNQMVDTQVLAELVAAYDNSEAGATLLVSLLQQISGEGQEDDISSVLNLMTLILNHFPVAANKFCLSGICSVIRSLYHHPMRSSPRVLTSCSLLALNILRSVDPLTLRKHEEAWVPISLKLLDILIPKLASGTCDHEGHLLISVLVLILHHSTKQALTEASKTILLNTSLVSTVNDMIQGSCASGRALIDLDEETSTGETLVLVLLLHLFSLRSLPAILQLDLDWQDFLEASIVTQRLSVICIRCNDLCRLIHFGSSTIKLVASQCLLELLVRITAQRNGKRDELRCSGGYLQSVMAVLEGLVFHTDLRVAMNCGLCLSVILGWEKLGLQEKRAIRDDNWCRLVMEELVLSLAAPGLASKSFTNRHKPAAHVAIALLRLDQGPGWMKSVFNASGISTIIDNLSASNVSTEMVELFQELVAHEYVKSEQIRVLHHVFQVVGNVVRGTRINNPRSPWCVRWIRDRKAIHITRSDRGALRIDRQQLSQLVKDVIGAQLLRNVGALLTILAQKGYFEKSFATDQSGSSREANNFTQTTKYAADTSLIMLFVEAIKGSLLSSNTQIQISALDLVFHSLSSEVDLVKQIGVLVEESVADYVFEMLRLSTKLAFYENKDPLLVLCLQVLSLLATAEHVFRQRLVIGFPTWVLVLRYVAEVPLHPVQSHTLRLVWSCISSFPGIVSNSQAEDLFQVLTNMFGGHSSGEIGMLSDTFTLACSTFVVLLKTQLSQDVQDLAALVQNASTDVDLAPFVFLVELGIKIYYSLYLLKEAYAYYHEENCNVDLENKELTISLTEACRKRVYMETPQGHCGGVEHFEQLASVPEDSGKMIKLLLNLVPSPCIIALDQGFQAEGTRLLEQIEMFFQVTITRDDEVLYGKS